MNRFFSNLIIIATFFAIPNLAMAHGGTYIPPGDVVPPGGTGAQPPTPISPPSGPEPTGPVTPHGPPTGPTGSPPGRPTTPPNQPVGARNGPVTDVSIPPDLGQWTFWWEFNKDRFLNLKTKVRSKVTYTDSGLLVGLGRGARPAFSMGPSDQDVKTRIVPMLLTLLEKESDRDILTGAMVALGRIGVAPDAVVTAITPQLAASNQEVRETAALSLGILQRPEAIPTLEALAWDTPEGRKLVKDSRVDIRTRVFAQYGLGLIGQASTDPEVKNYLAQRALKMLQEDKSALKDLRVAAALSLARIAPPNPEDIIPTLEQMLAKETQDSLVLAHLPQAIAHLLQGVPAESPLFQQSTDTFLAQLGARRPHRWLSRSIVQALGIMAQDHQDAKESWARPILVTLQEISKRHRDHQTRAFALISLAFLGTNSDEVRSDVVQTLIQGMDKMSTPLRPWCALALGVLSFESGEGDHPHTAIIHAALREQFEKIKSPESRGAYAIALGLCDDHEALPALKKAMLENRENTFRGYCAVSIGLIGDPAQKVALMELVVEAKRDIDMMRQANVGLGLLGDRSAVDNLIKQLRPEGNRQPRLATLAGVASALGFIGDRSAVSPLLDAIQDDRLTPLGRAFAVVALGMVADKATLPWRSEYSVDLNYLAGVSTLLDPNSGTGLLDIL